MAFTGKLRENAAETLQALSLNKLETRYVPSNLEHVLHTQVKIVLHEKKNSWHIPAHLKKYRMICRANFY